MGTLSGAEAMSHSCFQSILSTRLLDLRFEYDRGWAGDAAIFAHTPEVHDHQHRSDNGNADAVPDIGTKESVRVHDRTPQQSEANIVVGGHTQLWTERALMSKTWCSSSHVGTDCDGPEPELIVG